MPGTRLHKMFSARSPMRLWLTLVCLFTSTLQSSLAETHFHSRVTPFSTVAQGFVPAAQHSAPQAVSDDAALCRKPVQRHVSGDDASCPLCSVLLAGGALPSVAYQIPTRPLSSSEAARVDQVPSCLISAVSYAWRSRGPPSRLT